jgi:hypothetical protein
MVKKEIVCVMAHATNEEKRTLLRRCIQSIRSHGYEVMICSHVNVPDDLIEISDYFVHGKNNPIITYDEYETIGGGLFYWQDFPQYYMSKMVDLNHGPAHLRLMLRGASIANIEGYNVIHLINYDYIINDSTVLSNASTTLDIKDAYFFSRFNSDTIITGMMSIRVDSLLKNYGHILSKQDYCVYGISIFEDLFLHIAKESGMLYHIEESSNLDDRVEQDLINITYAYGLYNCEGTNVRIVPCIDDFGQYYLLLSVDQELKENYLNIYHRGRYYSVSASGTQFIELSDMLEHGIIVTLSKGQVCLRIDSKSNISRCVIKDTQIVTKLI